MSLAVNNLASSLITANQLTNNQAKSADAVDAAPAALTAKKTADDNSAVLETDTYESTLGGLKSSVENLTSALGRIQDQGLARQAVEQLKQQFLQNPMAAMLAQANQSQQNVSALLR